MRDSEEFPSREKFGQNQLERLGALLGTSTLNSQPCFGSLSFKSRERPGQGSSTSGKGLPRPRPPPGQSGKMASPLLPHLYGPSRGSRELLPLCVFILVLFMVSGLFYLWLLIRRPRPTKPATGDRLPRMNSESLVAKVEIAPAPRPPEKEKPEGEPDKKIEGRVRHGNRALGLLRDRQRQDLRRALIRFLEELGKAIGLPLEVREWNAEKGFGFIIPLVREDEEAPKSIFVHLWTLGDHPVPPARPPPKAEVVNPPEECGGQHQQESHQPPGGLQGPLQVGGACGGMKCLRASRSRKFRVSFKGFGAGQDFLGSELQLLREAVSQRPCLKESLPRGLGKASFRCNTW